MNESQNPRLSELEFNANDVIADREARLNLVLVANPTSRSELRPQRQLIKSSHNQETIGNISESLVSDFHISNQVQTPD